MTVGRTAGLIGALTVGALTVRSLSIPRKRGCIRCWRSLRRSMPRPASTTCGHHRSCVAPGYPWRGWRWSTPTLTASLDWIAIAVAFAALFVRPRYAAATSADAGLGGIERSRRCGLRAVGADTRRPAAHNEFAGRPCFGFMDFSRRGWKAVCRRDPHRRCARASSAELRRDVALLCAWIVLPVAIGIGASILWRPIFLSSLCDRLSPAAAPACPPSAGPSMPRTGEVRSYVLGLLRLLP